ncbi:MAG TPA: MCE family protein [Nocardioidaceae bacterium]|nr:MCE family protein [Nocardioidaceae bacterium]
MKTTLVKLGLALALVAGSTTGCGIIGGGSMELTAEFADTAGLFVGNDVGILGVRVGQVTKIEPQGDSSKVTFEITADGVSIPADAQALIVSRSVATDRYIEITPTYADGAKIADGANIPVDRTQTPVDFDQVLTALNEFSVGIAGSKDTADAVRRFLDVSARTFGPSGEDMNRAITNLGEAVNSVSAQRENIVGTFNSLDTLASNLVQNRQVVQDFVDSLAATTRLLADERVNFRDALVKLSRTVEVVAKFAQDNKDKLKGAVSDVAVVTDILLSRKPQLEEFIEVAPLVLQNLQLAKAPGGILIRAPFGDILTGGVLSQVCNQLPVSLCDIIGSNPVGPLVDLIEQLLGGGLGG